MAVRILSQDPTALFDRLFARLFVLWRNKATKAKRPDARIDRPGELGQPMERLFAVELT